MSKELSLTQNNSFEQNKRTDENEIYFATQQNGPLINNIENKIFTIREMQVMLDSELAKLYQTETKYINRAVNRNPDRFPSTFAFQLDETEWNTLRFQIGTLENQKGRGQHRKYLPWVFTEQGVAMLSAVLNTNKAVQNSVQIMQAFIAMRKFLTKNAIIFQRINVLEHKQHKTDEKLEEVFKILESNQPKPEKGIFFDGQIFDAYLFVSDVIKNAQTKIILIDNYVDESVLGILSKRGTNVSAIIYTKNISEQLRIDLKKHNSQYPEIKIVEFNGAHDRFLIIDDHELYHFGASLKDLGKKWFAFSRMDSFVNEVLLKLKKIG